MPTYHIADPDCMVSAGEIRHQPVGAKAEVEATDWLPADGPLSVGLTSGASTPDNLVEQVIRQLSDFANTN